MTDDTYHGVACNRQRLEAADAAQAQQLLSGCHPVIPEGQHLQLWASVQPLHRGDLVGVEGHVAKGGQGLQSTYLADLVEGEVQPLQV